MVEKKGRTVKDTDKITSIDFPKLGINIPVLPDPLLPVKTPDLEKFPKPSDYAFTVTYNVITDTVKTIGDSFNTKLVVDDRPADGSGADFCVPCHPLAAAFRKSPKLIAEEIAGGMQDFPYIKDAKAVNGFINFEVDMGAYGGQVLSQIESLGENYGKQNTGNGNAVVIDCSSPNIAKEMSIGHLRSTIIGESLARIYAAAGYTVIRDNHLGDWGTQFGMLGEAYNRWRDEVADLINGPNPVKGLNRLYVKINDEIAREGGNQSPLYESGKQWFQRLEQGDPEAIDLWRWTVELSLKEFGRVYQLLDTKYEYMLGESEYVGMLGAVVKSMVDNGVAAKDDDGAIIVHFNNSNLGKLVVQKSDGTSVYATRDLAALAARTEWFHPEKILYVVGGEQKQYFQQVFEAFNMLVGGRGPEIEHVPFGMVKLGKEKMSSRKGRVILLEDLLTESISKAKEKIKQGQIDKEQALTEEEVDTIARKVGVGAVVFLDLVQSRERQISLDVEEDVVENGGVLIKPDWDKILSFDGNSAPYIQYAHTRAQSIIKRANEIGIDIDTIPSASFNTPIEKSLVKQLSRFPAAIQSAIAQNEPYIISDYSYQLAELFNRFYKQEKVISEPDSAKRNDRLRLTAAVAQVIRNSLQLVCIEAPEKM